VTEDFIRGPQPLRETLTTLPPSQGRQGGAGVRFWRHQSAFQRWLTGPRPISEAPDERVDFEFDTLAPYPPLHPGPGRYTASVDPLAVGAGPSREYDAY